MSDDRIAPERLHAELLALVDARAGKTHSATGRVATTLREVVDRAWTDGYTTGFADSDAVVPRE